MKKEQNGTTQPKVWIEKTLIKGRKDREEGKRALGKAYGLLKQINEELTYTRI
jgi:hypothetical protein